VRAKVVRLLLVAGTCLTRLEVSVVPLAAILLIEALIRLLEVSVVIRLVLAPAVVIVTRVVVLIAEAVAVTHAAVDIENALNHSDSLLTAEVLPVDVVDLPLFNELHWQNRVFQKYCLVLIVERVDVAHLDNLVALAHSLDLVIVCLADELLSKVLQSVDLEAAALHCVLRLKIESLLLLVVFGHYIAQIFQLIEH